MNTQKCMRADEEMIWMYIERPSPSRLSLDEVLQVMKLMELKEVVKALSKVQECIEPARVADSRRERQEAHEDDAHLHGHVPFC